MTNFVVVMALMAFALGGALGASAASTSHLTVRVHPGHDPATLITTLPNGDHSGTVIAIGTGIYIEDWSTGKLFHWDSTHGLTLVANPPTGGTFSGYWGMAAGVDNGLLTIFLVTFNGIGLYTCVKPGISACAFESSFIPISPSFCASQPSGFCEPLGVAFRGGNLFYADNSNLEEVELLGATGFTTGLVFHKFSFGPEGLFIDSAGNHWVTSFNCPGAVYKNGVLFKSIAAGSSESVVISTANPSATAHVYVGTDGFCSGFPNAGIIDLTDGKALPTVSSGGSFSLPEFSTNFYFSDNEAGQIYKTADTASPGGD